MDRAKALDKIEKCLALGKSPNEHEAAAAMRQAQNLMRNFGITEDELGLIGYSSEEVQTSIQAGRGRKYPLTLSLIANLMDHAFGVRVVIVPVKLKTDYNLKVVYFGRKDRVLLAGYAHVVVARAVEAAWQRHLKENFWLKGQQGARAGFYLGWIRTVAKTVEEFAISPEERAAAEKLLRNTFTNVAPAERNKQAVSAETHAAGKGAAAGFSLHRPMNGTESLKIAN